MSYVYVLVTVALTTYGQLVIKWRAADAGELPSGAGAIASHLVRLLLDPWVITSLCAAAIAALTYMAALSDLPLSRAYPVMSLSFVAVLFLSAVFFQDALTGPKIAGVALILVGIVLATR